MVGSSKNKKTKRMDVDNGCGKLKRRKTKRRREGLKKIKKSARSHPKSGFKPRLDQRSFVYSVLFMDGESKRKWMEANLVVLGIE